MSEARRYRWASLVVDCDLPLPELNAAGGRRRADIVVRRAAASRDRRRGRAPTTRHEWRLPDGTRWASVASGDGEHVLRFRRFAEFVVTGGGRSVRWRAPASTKPETIRHLLLDQVLPAIAFEHSLIALHASAVVVDGVGVAFAGPTSRGKSTLAASFAVHGHPVVTDDSLMMDWRAPSPRAIPSYPSLRLWRDTADRLFGRRVSTKPVAQYTSKLRVGAAARALTFRRLPVHVGKIYIVERRAGAARVVPLSRREAYVELLKTTFRLDPLDRDAARREVAALSSIVQQVPVARLLVPLRLDRLNGVRQLVAADLAGSG